MKLASLYKKSIVMDLSSNDKENALQELVKAAKAAHAIRGLNVDDVVKAIIAREKLGSTGLGRGVAIPHVKCDAVKSAVGAFGRSAPGISYGAVDGEPVHLLFLILASAAKPEEYTRALRCVATAVRRPHFIKFARNSRTSKEIEELFREADEAAVAAP